MNVKISIKSILIIQAVLITILLFALCICNSCIDINVFCLKCLDNNDIIQLLLLLFTTLGFIITIKTFTKTNQIKKAEFYLDFKNRFKTNASFNEIRHLIFELNKDKENTGLKEKLLAKTRIERIDYAGFLEEIQVLVTKKLISKKDVYFSFGQYILGCDKCEPFWEDLKKDDPLWRQFNFLCREMENQKKKLTK